MRTIVRRARRGVAMLASLVALLYASASAASIVRGRIDRDAKLPPTPAAGIRITILNDKTGRSAPVSTGPDGLFTIEHVAPGENTLEVWVSTDAQAKPVSFRITVVEPYTDVPPIALPKP